MEHHWKDKSWMNQRKKNNSLQSPYSSIYEVHLASWMRPDKRQ
jgi:1,4-alpha-glucan branching enzyme